KRSTRTKSVSSCSKTRRPCFPCSAVKTRYPARSSSNWMTSRIDFWSSMIRMVAIDLHPLPGVAHTATPTFCTLVAERDKSRYCRNGQVRVPKYKKYINNSQHGPPHLPNTTNFCLDGAQI